MEIRFSSSSAECGHESMKCSSIFGRALYFAGKKNKRLSNKMASTYYNNNSCTKFPYLQIPMWIGFSTQKTQSTIPVRSEFHDFWFIYQFSIWKSEQNYAQLNSCQNDRKCRKIVCVCACVCSFKLNTRVHTACHMSVDDGWTTNEPIAIFTKKNK